MNHTNRRRIETAACERRYGIADAKGAEYSGAGSTYRETGADTLANFKKVAARIGGTPEQVLLTYMLKHMDSITTTVREAAQYNATEGVGLQNAIKFKRETYAKGEGIVSRLDDIRNYADLCECLLIDLGLIYDPDDTAKVGFDRWPWETEPEMWVGPTKTSVGEDDNGDSMVNEGGYVNPMEDIPPQVTPEEFEDITGMTKCFDGVWRQKPDVDPSVTPGTPPGTPMYRLDETTGHIRYDR